MESKFSTMTVKRLVMIDQGAALYAKYLLSIPLVFLYLNFRMVFNPEPTKNRDSVEFTGKLPRIITKSVSNVTTNNSRPSRKGGENSYGGNFCMIPARNVG